MRRLLLPIPLVVAALLGATVAQGEITQEGNLRIAFNGKLSPRELPRDRPAPVTASLDSSIRTTDGSDPPPLRKISIAINRQGRVNFEGLPTCDPADLRQTTSAAAREACGPALVGHGRFAGVVSFPGRAPLPAEGRTLAFNGRLGGKPALFLHIFSSNPIRITFVLPFEISRQPGKKFGTVFSAKIPRIAAESGHITDIELTIGRKYRYEGRPRSFLSASCAAPEGFTLAFFTLARTSFVFADDRTVNMTIIRDCRVR